MYFRFKMHSYSTSFYTGRLQTCTAHSAGLYETQLLVASECRDDTHMNDAIAKRTNCLFAQVEHYKPPHVVAAAKSMSIKLIQLK